MVAFDLCAGCIAGMICCKKTHSVFPPSRLHVVTRCSSHKQAYLQKNRRGSPTISDTQSFLRKNGASIKAKPALTAKIIEIHATHKSGRLLATHYDIRREKTQESPGTARAIIFFFLFSPSLLVILPYRSPDLLFLFEMAIILEKRFQRIVFLLPFPFA